MSMYHGNPLQDKLVNECNRSQCPNCLDDNTFELDQEFKDITRCTHSCCNCDLDFKANDEPELTIEVKRLDEL